MNIIDTYLEDSEYFLSEEETCFLENYEFSNIDKIKFEELELNEKSSLVNRGLIKSVNFTLNRPETIVLSIKIAMSKLNTDIRKANTKADLDIILNRIEKMENDIDKVKKLRVPRSNIIPVVDRNIKEKAFEKYRIKINNLKQKALDKRKTLK